MPAVVPATGTALMIPVGDAFVPMEIPQHLRPAARQEFKRLARDEKARATVAGNRATLLYTLGGTVGGAMATGGLIALATASGPIGWAGIAVAGIGSITTAAGVWFGHVQSNIKAIYEKRAETYRDLAEELT